MSILKSEVEKYDKIWSVPAYRDATGGHRFFDNHVCGVLGNLDSGATIIDFGCGSGRGAEAAAKAGLKPTLLDIVDVRENAVRGHPFIQQPLWHPIEGSWRYGMCGDVLEHLPMQFTALAVANMASVCEDLVCTISTVPDRGGALIGETLHLTVCPFVWWRDTLREVVDLVDARDLLTQGIFHVRKRTS